MVKQRIHPSIDEETLNILKKYGLKPSEALNQYTCFLVTNNIRTTLEEEMLKEKKQELQKQKKTIDKQIENVDIKLEKIRELKKEFIPVGSSNFDEALHTITARIKAIIDMEEQGKWDLRKIPFEDVLIICSYHRVPIEAVLSRIPTNMKRYIEGYVLPDDTS